MTDYIDNTNARHDMKFQIKNRRTGDVQFECELPPKVARMSYSMKLGYAVREADMKRLAEAEAASASASD